MKYCKTITYLRYTLLRVNFNCYLTLLNNGINHSDYTILNMTIKHHYSKPLNSYHSYIYIQTTTKTHIKRLLKDCYIKFALDYFIWFVKLLLTIRIIILFRSRLGPPPNAEDKIASNYLYNEDFDIDLNLTDLDDQSSMYESQYTFCTCSYCEEESNRSPFNNVPGNRFSFCERYASTCTL